MDSLLTIVIPCYNEQDNIPVFFPELLKFAEENTFQVIVVNDGSRDRSAEELNKFSNRSCLQVITHKCNRGYGGAIKTGLRAVKTAYAITIDSDGQHRLEDVKKCFEHIRNTNSDLTVGSRTNNESGGYRTLGKKVIRAFAGSLLELPIRDLNSGMKCYRVSETLNYLDLCPDTMAFSDVILLLMVNDRKLVTETPITVAPRTAGKSTIGTKTALVTLAEILNLAILLRPITTFFRVGVFFVLIGIAWGIFTYINSRIISSAAVLPIIFGCFCFVLGLLGEQLTQIRRALVRINEGKK